MYFMMRLSFLVCLIVLSLVPCNAQQNNKISSRRLPQTYQALFPVQQNGKWGYIDNKGKLIVTPQFDIAGLFSEGFAVVRIAGGWSFIDTSGKLIIIPMKDGEFELGTFSEGLLIAVRGSKRGYLDRTGRLAVGWFDADSEGAFIRLGNFSEGVAPVMSGGKGGYIDKTGKYVITPQFERVLPFSDGLALVEVGGKFGFIDHSGRFAINPQFDYADPFSEGLSIAVTSVRDGSKTCFIDKTGKFILKNIANLNFGNAGDFHEDRALVMMNGKFGYLDRTGTLIIKPQFDRPNNSPADDVGKFSEGLAVVSVGAKRGYINKFGKLLIKAQFDGAHPFTSGLAQVDIGGKIGWIDKAGRYIWNPTK